MRELVDAARELLEHLEDCVDFPQNPTERKMSNRLYEAIAKAEREMDQNPPERYSNKRQRIGASS